MLGFFGAKETHLLMVVNENGGVILDRKNNDTSDE